MKSTAEAIVHPTNSSFYFGGEVGKLDFEKNFCFSKFSDSVYLFEYVLDYSPQGHYFFKIHHHACLHIHMLESKK